MQEKFGHEAFNIIPDSYVLPDEWVDFNVHYNELKKDAPYKNLWICKPSSSCQGKGIYITDNIHDISRVDKCVIGRYIHNPLLINSHKFDLRVYVLITSFEPLRVYVFQEGLTRFASESYSSRNKFNKFSHLTNYSINKKNANFVQNVDLEHDDFGFKWSLAALCGHLEQIGIDMDLLWSKIYDLIIKAIISAEDKIIAGMNKHCNHKSNCFEILGFDVLIDSELRPWLLEANLSPSLSSDSPLDFKIKSNLVTDAFNIIGFKKYDRRKESVNKIKHRMKDLYARSKSMKNRYGGNNFSYSYKDKGSMKSFTQNPKNIDVDSEFSRYLQSDTTLARHSRVIKKLIPLKFKEMLKQTLEEDSRRSNFIRIYPAKGTDVYDKYFKGVRPYNVFLYKCLYTDEIIPNGFNESIKDVPRLTADDSKHKIEHLNNLSEAQVVQKQKSSTQKAERPQTVKVGAKSSLQSLSLKEKVIITGDDVLIEYVSRLIGALSVISEANLTTDIRLGIDKFILHYVWHSKDPANQDPTCSLKRRLETRYEEMRQRRRRLVKSIYKREGKLDIFEQSYKKMAQTKMKVLQNFNGAKLEEMLKTSTKNVAQEVVSILLKHSSRLSYGILPDIEKCFGLESNARSKTLMSKSASSKIEQQDCGEDDDRDDEEVPHNNKILASSNVSNATNVSSINKFSSISDFNKKLVKQPPQVPPTINYNNYFNHDKYRYSSKSRVISASGSMSSTHKNHITRLKTASGSTMSATRKPKDTASRRNSVKTSESEYIKTTKPVRKTYRSDLQEQRRANSGMGIKSTKEMPGKAGNKPNLLSSHNQLDLLFLKILDILLSYFLQLSDSRYILLYFHLLQQYSFLLF